MDRNVAGDNVMNRGLSRLRNAGRILHFIPPLALSLIFITFFAILPLLYFLGTGFSEGGFEGIGNVISGPFYRKVILFTVAQAVLSFALTILLSLPMAYLMVKYDFPGKRALLSLTTVPFILPPLVVAVGFYSLFGTKGYVNLFLHEILGLEYSLNLLYTWKAIILAHVFYNFSIALRIIHSRWSQIDEEQILVARSLGAKPRMAFLKITLPQLIPAIASASLLVFIFCFMTFAVVLILGDGVRYITLEVALYRKFFFDFDFSTGSALAAVEVAVVLLGTYLYLRLSSRWGENIIMSVEERRGGRWREAPISHRVLLLAYLVASLFLVVGPLVGVILKSFQSELGAGGYLTLRWYKRILFGGYSSFIGVSPFQTIINSLVFAFLTVLITVPVATASAYALRSLPGRFRAPVELYLMVPLGVSGVVLAISMRVFYLNFYKPLTYSPYIIVLAHSLIAYPLSLRILSTGFASIEKSIVEASRSLGATPFKSFLYVVLPLVKPYIIVSALFSFAISLGDFGATLVLYTPEYTTMPIAIYRFISAGRDFGSSYAFSALLILLGFVCFYAIDRLSKLGRK
ncbi:MAG: iron ABC transporter permease [Thermoplasmata archaeon]|nr:iron ABC transporter permease [Thermoplasmata archaeon]